MTQCCSNADLFAYEMSDAGALVLRSALYPLCHVCRVRVFVRCVLCRSSFECENMEHLGHVKGPTHGNEPVARISQCVQCRADADADPNLLRYNGKNCPEPGNLEHGSLLKHPISVSWRILSTFMCIWSERHILIHGESHYPKSPKDIEANTEIQLFERCGLFWPFRVNRLLLQNPAFSASGPDVPAKCKLEQRLTNWTEYDCAGIED